MALTQAQKAVTAAFTLGGVIGIVASHYVTKRVLRDQLDAEIEDVKANYRKVDLEDFDIDYNQSKFLREEAPMDTMKYEHIIEKSGYSLKGTPDLKADEVVAGQVSPEKLAQLKDVLENRRNVFDDNAATEAELTDEDREKFFEKLVSERTEEAPYIISVVEYFEESLHIQKINMTYFEEDEVLMGEDEEPVEDIDKTVGKVNLQRFGIASDDPMIVYVRNPKHGVDIEIIKEENSYARVVKGHEDS